jgi:hypothetical protein
MGDVKDESITTVCDVKDENITTVCAFVAQLCIYALGAEEYKWTFLHFLGVHPSGGGGDEGNGIAH